MNNFANKIIKLIIMSKNCLKSEMCDVLSLLVAFISLVFSTVNYIQIWNEKNRQEELRFAN